MRLTPLLFLLSVLLMAWPNNATGKAKSKRPAHHGENGKFVNPYVTQHPGAGGLLKWKLGLGPQEDMPVALEPASHSPAPVTTTHLTRILNPNPEELQVTWIGHATMLLQFRGTNVLTDPIFSDRASPISFLGPERLVSPGIALRDLPPIHAVVISHNHYDHLDAPTIKSLGNTPRYFVPLKMADWFRKCGITHITELDWWQSSLFHGVRFHSVPTQHFSGRFPPIDENRVLWTGWVIETGKGNVFFAGDTGHTPQFKEVGERLGPMRLAIIPIGAYRPRWFMAPVHVSPLEAVQVHLDVRAAHSVGMHWGTFDLTDEPLGEPPIYLRKVVRDKGLPTDAFTAMAIGETRTY